MGKTKQTRGQEGTTASAGTGALLGSVDEEMAPNNEATHQGLHDSIETDLHFGDDIHGPDQQPEDWKEPNALDAPPARPGMTQRWIRISLVGKIDGKNQSNQGQMGWRPRGLNTVPEGERGRYPTIRDKRTGGEFMVSGDLILCEMSLQRFEQIRAHYRAKAQRQQNALRDNIARAAIPGSEAHGVHAPEVVERSSRVSTRKPIVQAD